MKLNRNKLGVAMANKSFDFTGLRVIIPSNRSIAPDEYEPISRKVASLIGMELCDPTTFELTRLMYWASCCSDSA